MNFFEKYLAYNLRDSKEERRKREGWKDVSIFTEMAQRGVNWRPQDKLG